MADFTIKRGDTLKPFIVDLWTTIDGVTSPADFSDLSIRRVYMKRKGAAALTVDREPNSLVTDGTRTRVTLNFQAAEVAEPGVYEVEVEGRDAQGNRRTWPDGSDGVEYWTVLIVDDLD